MTTSYSKAMQLLFGTNYHHLVLFFVLICRVGAAKTATTNTPVAHTATAAAAAAAVAMVPSPPSPASPPPPPASPICAAFGDKRTKVCADSLVFEQTLDHFRFAPMPRATFKQRYLQHDGYWGKGTSPLTMPAGCKGPILFYTGNEGPIDAFWAANGFMIHDLAPRWGALLLFAEERYYGESQPFGTNANSLTPDNAVYLSTEQVLADYARLLTSIKRDLPGALNCPVLNFGGSYGGTLSTYFRAKYPALTVGALASSAPIGYYANSGWADHGVTNYTWIDIVQRVFSETRHGTACMDTLRATVSAVRAAATASPTGRAKVAEQMHACNGAVLGTPDPAFFLTDALETLPQMDYPYAIGTLPAWPVNATCDMAAATLAAIMEQEEEQAKEVAAVAVAVANEMKKTKEQQQENENNKQNNKNKSNNKNSSNVSTATTTTIPPPPPPSSFSSSFSSFSSFSSSTTTSSLLLALAANITDMYYGYTPGGACISTQGQGGIPGGGPGPASWGSWGYQSCTETLHAFSSRASAGHGFRDFSFDSEAAAKSCIEYFGTSPDPWWAEAHFGGYALSNGISGVNHVIWSNGGRDPWHGGGFLQPLPSSAAQKDQLFWFFMPEGAHHLDLREGRNADPINVTQTRARETEIMAKWLVGSDV